MYAGHVGIALGAVGIRDTIPLWLLVLAAQLPDWADAGLCMAGVRTPVPGMYTHSLPAIAALAGVLSALYYVVSRDRAGAGIVGIVVVTHMLADYVTGSKPTWPGGPIIGLGLYDNPPVDFAIEAAAIGCGWMIYRKSFAESRRNILPVNLIPAALLLFQLAAVIAFSVAPPLSKC